MVDIGWFDPRVYFYFVFIFGISVEIKKKSEEEWLDFVMFLRSNVLAFNFFLSSSPFFDATCHNINDRG